MDRRHDQQEACNLHLGLEQCHLRGSLNHYSGHLHHKLRYWVSPDYVASFILLGLSILKKPTISFVFVKLHKVNEVLVALGHHYLRQSIARFDWAWQVIR